VQRRATHDLHVEVPLAQGALGRLAHRREGLGQELSSRVSPSARRFLKTSVSARSSASVSFSKSSSRR
jgi:hypothetical protein